MHLKKRRKQGKVLLSAISEVKNEGKEKSFHCLVEMNLQKTEVVLSEL